MVMPPVFVVPHLFPPPTDGLVRDERRTLPVVRSEMQMHNPGLPDLPSRCVV